MRDLREAVSDSLEVEDDFRIEISDSRADLVFSDSEKKNVSTRAINEIFKRYTLTGCVKGFSQLF